MHKQELLRKGDICIRMAVCDDSVAIAALATELAVQEGQMPHTTEETLARDVFCDVPQCNMLVAEYEGQVLGFVMFYGGYDLASAAAGYHLGDIVVTPSHRGRGIGTLLMQALAKYAISHEKLWVSWTVSTGNESAKKFYFNAVGATEVQVDFMAIGKTSLHALTER